MQRISELPVDLTQTCESSYRPVRGLRFEIRMFVFKVNTFNWSYVNVIRGRELITKQWAAVQDRHFADTLCNTAGDLTYRFCALLFYLRVSKFKPGHFSKVLVFSESDSRDETPKYVLVCHKSKRVSDIFCVSEILTDRSHTIFRGQIHIMWNVLNVYDVTMLILYLII
jgi:hypothetical protein